uniref:Uncharacterized protein n=1 Tax=Triticum urartu TaxID=4572 RepID=A0A8R7V232_TRIUA
SVASAVLVPGAGALVEAVLHGLLAVGHLGLVQLGLGGGDLGLAPLVRQRTLVVRPRRGRLGLLGHLGLRDLGLGLGRARGVLHLLLGVIHLDIVSILIWIWLLLLA